MATTEHTINDALAEVLRKTRHAWHFSNVIKSENSGMLKGSSKQPDILVVEANVSPVVIETEILPAVSVEAEAVSRLGEKVRNSGRTILSSIALRLPIELRKLHGVELQQLIATTNKIEMALYTGTDPSSFSRWPSSGWMVGNIADLSILTQSASIPPAVIEEAADQLVNGVSEAAGLLEDIVLEHPGAIHKICNELHQQDSKQTRRMVTTILVNAFIFHDSLAGGPDKLKEVKSLEEIRGSITELSKSAILDEWRKILKVNYWPIFDIARRILEIIPATSCKELLGLLAKTASKLLENRLMHSHDLTGAVFQRLIADRKFLAAFYTTPASAALLAGLAISSEHTPNKMPWSDVEAIKNLRVADFACGTGTLLSSTYQRIGQLHELAGGDAEALHPALMSTGLLGCDVLPAAAHLTASMLSGAHPTVKYDKSSIMTVAYGKQPNDVIALGSLDLLDPEKKFDIVSITAKVAESMGESEKEAWSPCPDASFDLVIMNPPFTRATGHEGNKIGIPNPMFAAFSSSGDEQRSMSNATKRLTNGTSAHGNAGEASIFLVLADRKLKNRGVLALVMPLSLVSGDAWENSRALLANRYGDLIIISIAGSHDTDTSFSAETGMGECLIIGRKNSGRKNSGRKKRATFVILNERPAYPMVGANAARQIQQMISDKNIRRIEDGPIGGTHIHFGNDVIGQAVDAPLPIFGGWNLARIADVSLAETAYQMQYNNRIWLPAMSVSQVVKIPITTVIQIGKIGPYHMDINGKTAKGGIRGPFKVHPNNPNMVPTYPVLWSHDATKERALCFEAESEAQPLKGRNSTEQELVSERVKNIWETASHCHFNRDFRFNSQSTAMQFTKRLTIGGRAWPSISLKLADYEKALVLWANTSLGLLLHWWHANKQQSGRGSIGVKSLRNLPILDVTSLTSKQLEEAVKIFDEMKAAELLPLHKIDEDPVRQELDRKFASKVLDIDKSIYSPGGTLELLRMKLAKEPSIRGGK